MAKFKITEAAFMRALKKLNEVTDPWREAEDAYLMRERLPKGMEKIEGPDGEVIYRDADGNEYVKNEYGHLVPIESEEEPVEDFEEQTDLTEQDPMSTSVQTDFTNWASMEANQQHSLGVNNPLGLMYDYYFNQNDSALYELVDMYKDARGLDYEDDSQEDIWVAEEVRRAIDAWGNAQEDMEEEPETDLGECGKSPLMEAYGVGYQGRFISEKPGWGPTFTSFPEDAKKFNSPDEAQAYIDEYLPDFGANVVGLPSGDDNMLYENGDEEGGVEIDPNKVYWVRAGSSFPIDIKLKGEYINYCSQGMGSDNFENAREIMSIPEVQEQLNSIDDVQLDKWWGESYYDGMSDEEKMSADRETKLTYFLAEACMNAAEGDREEVTEELPQENPEEIAALKEAIKSLIRESFMSAYRNPVAPAIQQRPIDMQEKGGTWKSKHNPSNQHYKTNPKTHKDKRAAKRAIVIKWLRDPSVNCAEIMRQLWNPSPEDEDTKRGEFYKKRDGAINKQTKARYSFTDEEINKLYMIKSNRS